MTGTDDANRRSAGAAAGSAAGGAPAAAAGGTTQSARGRAVRDREVLLLAAFCVVVVLGLQFLGIVFPPFADAIGRPPTVIVALVVVTAVVLARALWVSVRRG